MMNKEEAMQHVMAIKNECASHKKCGDCPFHDNDIKWCGLAGVPEDWLEHVDDIE